MDADGPKLLSNILTTEQLEQMPLQVQAKLKAWIAKFFDDYCKDKAAANRLDQYEQNTEDLQSQIQDLEVKLEKQIMNVDELRAQLDSVSAERVQLLQECEGYEREMLNLTKEKNFVVEERDSLLKELETKTRIADLNKSNYEDIKIEQNELYTCITDLKRMVTEANKQYGELETKFKATVREQELGERDNEREIIKLTREKNFVADERDSLLKIIDRQIWKLEQLQDEVHSYQQQLKNAVSAKCEAIARVNEIKSQKMAFDFKEHCMKQERSMLHNRLQTLTDDFNRNISEFQKIKCEIKKRNMHLEARFMEKCEELKISQAQCSQYKETILRLTENVQDLSAKFLNQNEEANKMMDHYKRELEAKTKIADLYKSVYEDNEIEQNELCTCITDLKSMVTEASQQYGELETKFKATVLKHEQELKERDNVIEEQKTELIHANELLKEVQHESTEAAIPKLEPSAAIPSRLIGTDLSLTKIYSMYIKTFEDLELQKRENSRITLLLNNILKELGEYAPINEKQKLEYEKLVEINNILSHQRDELLSKKIEMKEELENTLTKVNHSEQEIKKLNHSQSDLSRQICCLLKEIEQLRMGFVSDEEVAQTGNQTDDVISTKLVTFKNIAQLQENNERLLLLLRDLSCKLEDAETYKKRAEAEAWEEKLEAYDKKFQALQDILNEQNSTVATLVSKCERYKKMYSELHKKYTQGDFQMDLSDIQNVDMDDANDAANRDQLNSSRKSMKTNDLNTERHIRNLEQQLKNVRDQYKTMKEQYEHCFQEKKNNDRIMNEQFDSMRGEVRDLELTNHRLVSALEFSKEQVKLQQENIATYKQKISALEDCRKKYETTIVKLEQTVHFLKDEALKAQHGHTASKNEASHLRGENCILQDTVNKLLAEKAGYNRGQQIQYQLLNNLEIIRSNLERSEMGEKARLEQHLDETLRALSAQRLWFQEEEDRFRETTVHLNRQTESAIKATEERKREADMLRAELLSVREDITSKTKEIDELSCKFQEAREEAKLEIDSLNNELAKVREHAEYKCKMAQNADVEIKNMHHMHTEYTAKAEAEIKELKLKEVNLKSRVSELEAKVQIGNIAEKAAASSQSEHIKKQQDEIASLAAKLSECQREARAVRSENAALSESLNNVEANYANEMVSHSIDKQELSKVTNEVAEIQIQELITDHDYAKQLYTELKKSDGESIRLLQSEREEQEKRMADPSISNVTTSQAGISGGHKRPRELHGDSSTNVDEGISVKPAKHPNRGGETTMIGVTVQPTVTLWKQTSSVVKIVGSLKCSKLSFTETTIHCHENNVADDEAGDENKVTEKFEKLGNESATDATKKASTGALADMQESENVAEESPAAFASENIDNESHHSSGDTQSEMEGVQENQVEPMSEDNEGADGVSSEGEK